MTVDKALEIIAQTPVKHDVVSFVSSKKRWYSRTSNPKYNVVAVDCGIKLNIIRSLNARGCNVTVVPFNTDAESVLAMKPDGVFLSNGPGDPEDVTEVITLGQGTARQAADLRYLSRTSDDLACLWSKDL